MQVLGVRFIGLAIRKGTILALTAKELHAAFKPMEKKGFISNGYSKR